MVIKEDGTKWACQSCLKGHRVSGCTHTDRPLQFVPKKGRPVTQCQHCRVERKKRSAHVKCECGEKAHSKEKCIHLKNAEAVAALEQAKDLATVHEDSDSSSQLCCCSHGENCTCFITGKKTPEHGMDSSAAKAKPRLTTTQSEGVLTHFANGHHKPVHRNNAAHDANMPYRVHKPHPHAAHGLHVAARRSVDSLASADKAAKVELDWLQQMATAPQALSTTPTTNASPVFDAYIMPATTMAPSGADNFYAQQTNDAFMKNEVAEPVLPQSALSEASTDFNWDAFDWSAFGAMDQQPALTYASSHTISETGDHTPPDENVLGFNLQRVNGSNLAVNEVPNMAVQQMPRPVSNLVRQESNTNRWSLPPSFVLDGSGNNFDANVGYAAKKNTPVDANQFPAFDLTMSVAAGGPSIAQQEMPAQLYSADTTKTSTPMDQWQGNADDLFMQYANQMQGNFGQVNESDVPETMYTQGQANDFSFLGTPESLDFAQDFAQNGMTGSWTS